VPEADLVVSINPQSGGISVVSGRMWLGHHITVVEEDHQLHPLREGSAGSVLIIHSRGYSVGPKSDRMYVPASYHVFKVLDRDSAGNHRLRHMASFPVRMRLGGPKDAGMRMYWRPYPDPERTISNGHGSHRNPDPLSDGGTNLN
jgi:hypothetical protein